MVYVALSRVASLEGLYLTNANDDLTFHHTYDSTAPMIRQVQDEYKRLETHRLHTMTTEIKEFLGTTRDSTLIILNLNVQSLQAHAEDVTTDTLLREADLLVLSETWMKDSSVPVSLRGYHLVQAKSCSERSGGVAIYRRELCSHTLQIQNIGLEIPNRTLEDTTRGIGHAADFTISQIQVANKHTFLLAAIYVHQRAKYQDLVNVITDFLHPYDAEAPDGPITPIVLMGDFNTTDTDRSKLAQYLDQRFGLKLDTNVRDKTTLGGTCIDLTFSRGINLTCKCYVSYFSYHRPVFNKIELSQSQMGSPVQQ